MSEVPFRFSCDLNGFWRDSLGVVHGMVNGIEVPVAEAAEKVMAERAQLRDELETTKLQVEELKTQLKDHNAGVCGGKDYEDMRHFQTKFIESDHKARDLERLLRECEDLFESSVSWLHAHAADNDRQDVRVLADRVHAMHERLRKSRFVVK